jgi:septal ring factor EnvC (AmiA/AmiB activator)
MNEKTFLYIVISFVIIAFFVCIGYSVLGYTRGIESELERSKNTIAELELVAEQSRERLDREAKAIKHARAELERERASLDRERDELDRARELFNADRKRLDDDKITHSRLAELIDKSLRLIEASENSE